MIILGIDPGLASTGVAVIETGGSIGLMHHEVIRTSPRMDLPARLALIWDGLKVIVDDYRPAVLAIESAFVRRDTPQSGLSLGKVLGIVLLLAHRSKLKITEIAPREVKETLTGYGNASKEQIERAVAKWLGLKEPIRSTHASDAAAVALTAASIVARLRK